MYTRVFSMGKRIKKQAFFLSERRTFTTSKYKKVKPQKSVSALQKDKPTTHKKHNTDYIFPGQSLSV